MKPPISPNFVRAASSAAITAPTRVFKGLSCQPVIPRTRSISRRDFINYGIGYLLALLLAGTAFACVFYRLLSPGATFGAVLRLALIQIIVHKS
jgi:hypothetical protein